MKTDLINKHEFLSDKISLKRNINNGYSANSRLISNSYFLSKSHSESSKNNFLPLIKVDKLGFGQKPEEDDQEVIASFEMDGPAVSKKASIGFSGKKDLSKSDLNYCRNIIHGTAAACSGITFVHGDASALGFDTYALRGSQALMFHLLANRLGAPPIATYLYGAKEMYSAAHMAAAGAKMLTGAAGVFAHKASAVSGTSAATGGKAHAVISATVGGINSGVSFLITEKMGWGFVKRVNASQNQKRRHLAEIKIRLVAQ